MLGGSVHSRAGNESAFRRCRGWAKPSAKGGEQCGAEPSGRQQLRNPTPELSHCSNGNGRALRPSGRRGRARLL